MAPTKKREKRKTRRDLKSASKGEPATHSTDDTTESEIDKTKSGEDSNLSIDNIEAADSCLQAMTAKKVKYRKLTSDIQTADSSHEAIKDNTRYVRSTYVIPNSEQSHDILKSDPCDDEIKKIIKDVEESLKAYVKFRENYSAKTKAKNTKFSKCKSMVDPFVEQQNELIELLISEEPTFARHFSQCINMLKNIAETNIGFSTEDTTETGENSKAGKESHALKNKEEDATASSGVEVISEGLRKEYKKDEKEIDGFVANVQKSVESLQKTTSEVEIKKENIKCTEYMTSKNNQLHVDDQKTEKENNCIASGNVQASDQSANLMESCSQDEILADVTVAISKDAKKAKRISEMKHSNKISKSISPEGSEGKKSISQINNDSRKYSISENTNLDVKAMRKRGVNLASEILQKNRDLYSTLTDPSQENKETSAQKESEHSENDTVKELNEVEIKNVEKNSNTNNTGPTDSIEADGNSSPNASLNNDEKQNINSDRPKKDIQGFHSKKGMQKSISETKECVFDAKSSYNQMEILKSEKVKEIELNDRVKDVEQVQEHRGLEKEIKLLKKQRDLLFAEEPRTSFEGKSIAVELKNGATNKQDNLKDELLHLDEDDSIHFEFEISGNRHILMGGNYFFRTSRDKVIMKFDIVNKNIMVYFGVNHIFVSTPKSEFEIFIRKSLPIGSTDEATQLDTPL